MTGREAEVLALIGRHLTNLEIANELFISVRTVESHVSALLRKMQLSDRRSLARLAGSGASVLQDPDDGTLPRPVTPFIGRTAERAGLIAALAEHRLVTAIGPGGVGKTRLAISVATEIARSRRHGARFVDLAHVSDPAMVVATVAAAVGVPEQRSTPVDVALVATLVGRDLLLVLDNCEHVLDAARGCIDRIAAHCPHVTVLATSRARLMLPYERIFPVPGLSVSDDGGDAVALFSARVQAITGAADGLDTRRVATLCRALDGVALAIELAAARYPTLGLDALETGLDQRLRLLTSGNATPDRHRSLRDAIGWSYDLLAPSDQRLLRTVAVLASWFDVDAAAAVVVGEAHRIGVADALARLADDSLLVVDRGASTRYRTLEMIREYGVERLDAAGELDSVRARHEQWCRDAVAALAVEGGDDVWCHRFDRVVDDVRAALGWCAGDTHRAAEAAQLAVELAALLFVRGLLAEAQSRYEQAAGLAPTAAARAGHLRMAAGAAATRYAGNDTLQLLRAAADAAAEHGDRGAAARDLAWMSLYITRAPGIMARKPTPAEAAALRDEARQVSDGSNRAAAAVAVADVNPVDAPSAIDHGDEHRGLVERSRRAVELAHDTGDGVLESGALDQLICLHLALDDLPGAVRETVRRGRLSEPLAVDASTGFELLDHFTMASDVHLAAGDLVAAADDADALARLPFFRGDDHLALSRRIKVDALAGRFDDVVASGERFRVGWEWAGRPTAPVLAGATWAVAMVHGMLGDDERRTDWVRITIDLGVSQQSLAGCTTGWAPTLDALLALHRGDPAEALARLSADLDDPSVFGFWRTGLWRPWYAALWTEASVLAGHPDAARRSARGRLAARDNPIAASIVDRAIAVLAGDRAGLERCAQRFAELHCDYQRTRTGELAVTVR